MHIEAVAQLLCEHVALDEHVGAVVVQVYAWAPEFGGGKENRVLNVHR